MLAPTRALLLTSILGAKLVCRLVQRGSDRYCECLTTLGSAGTIPTMLMSDLQQALWGSGLIIRGGFHATAEDGIAIDNGPICTVILVGNVGHAL